MHKMRKKVKMKLNKFGYIQIGIALLYATLMVFSDRIFSIDIDTETLNYLIMTVWFVHSNFIENQKKKSDDCLALSE